jgi:hypothetical protein
MDSFDASSNFRTNIMNITASQTDKNDLTAPITHNPFCATVSVAARPSPRYALTTLGFPRMLPAFQISSGPESSSITQNDEVDASECSNQINKSSPHYPEDKVEAPEYHPALKAHTIATTQMKSRYHPSAITAGFDWGSDASNISDDSDELDTDLSDESDESDLDEDTNEITAVDANTSDGVEEYEPDASEDYDGRGQPHTYILTDRDLMISYGYKDGVHPLLHYDEHDNLVVEDVPVSSRLSQLDDEQSEAESEEVASADEIYNAQDASRPPATLAFAPVGTPPSTVAISTMAQPAVRPVTTKVAISKRNVAAKPRQKAQKDVFRAARTWVAKSNKTEMRQLLVEWFDEGYTNAENANDLSIRLSALQKAHIENLDNGEEDNESDEVIDERSEIGDETVIEKKALDVQTLQSSVQISGKSPHVTNATTITDVTDTEDELPATSPVLQAAYIKLLSDGSENKDASEVVDEESEVDGNRVYQTGESLSMKSINPNQDTDMAEVNHDVSARLSVSLIAKKRQRGDIEDKDDTLSEESTAKKAKGLDPYENVKQLGRPIKNAKKRAQV